MQKYGARGLCRQEGAFRFCCNAHLRVSKTFQGACKHLCNTELFAEHKLIHPGSELFFQTALSRAYGVFGCGHAHGNSGVVYFENVEQAQRNIVEVYSFARRLYVDYEIGELLKQGIPQPFPFAWR